MEGIKDSKEIGVGSVVYNAVRDELLFVVDRSIQVPAWKCYVLSPSTEKIKLFWLSMDELRLMNTQFYIPLGKWLCPPDEMDEILKLGKDGRRILVDLYHQAVEKLYRNLP